MKPLKETAGCNVFQTYLITELFLQSNSWNQYSEKRMLEKTNLEADKSRSLDPAYRTLHKYTGLSSFNLVTLSQVLDTSASRN